MQFLKISNSSTLSELSNRVGDRNVDSILALNGLTRTPYIGSAFNNLCTAAQSEYPMDDTTFNQSTWQKKSTMLQTFTEDSDVFEYACTQDPNGWKVLLELGTFSDMLRIPETIELPDASDLLGNGEHISKSIYQKAMSGLYGEDHTIDPAIFNTYSVMKPAKLVDLPENSYLTTGSSDPMKWFNLPWGDITLYSSLDGTSIDFPVYPEELDDGVSATYTTMPDMIYQYEPWQVYQSSGPRSGKYTFDMHRDMWSGDHRDGKCNELIRFCEANCYPEYNGSAVNVATVTFYIKGDALITGVMTDASVNWDGPIGLDGWYLHCKLSISITEVSSQPLNYTAVKSKGLIG